MYEVVIITGQTATGKTQHALEMAQKIKGELINCDSRQIYKDLDIITGKDIKEKNFTLVEQHDSLDIGYYRIEDTPVWLYDIVTPHVLFSSFAYKKSALLAIKHIQDKGKIPILVGGTYLYIKHLLAPFETEHIPPNEALRNELNGKDVTELQSILVKKDPAALEKMNNSDKHNPHRLIRKIEIYDFHTVYEKKQESPQNPLVKASSITGFRFEKKEDLILQISKRVEERVKNGAIKEVETILNKGYNADDPGLQTIGYKEIIEFLKGKISKDTAIKLWITSEVQYAKRQLTFMKESSQIIWKNI